MISALLVVSGTVIALAASQEPDAPFAAAIGQKVRVTVPIRTDPFEAGARRTDARVGILESFDGETLTIVVKGLPKPVSVGRDRVQRFEVSRGRERKWRQGAKTGAWAGGLLGLIPAGLCLAQYDACSDDNWQGLLWSPVVLGAAGGVAGALIGSAVEGDRWERVATRPRAGLPLGPVPGGLGVSVSMSPGRPRR